MHPGIGRRQQQVEPSGDLFRVAQIPLDGGAGEHFAPAGHPAVGTQVGEGQHLFLTPQHIGGGADAHHPAARLAEQAFQFLDVADRHQQDLAVGRFTRQHPPEGVEIGLLQQGRDHLLGLGRSLQLHLGGGQGLAAGQHHVAAAQGDQVGLQLVQFARTGGYLLAQLGEFRLGAANVGVAALHFSAEPAAFRL